MTAARGVLSVVATPIGNLSDISPRVHEALEHADLIAAEDTRRTGTLLEHLGLKVPQIACHKFSEQSVIARLLGELGAGHRVALVTDGGTPAISDPGSRLVAAAHAAGYRVEAIAGPSSVAAALSVAGLPADRFFFAGFLPARGAARRTAIADLARRRETLVVFEAPHRLAAALEDLALMLGPRPATLCRELTKLHEEVRPGTLADLAADVRARERVKGEIVLVIAGCPQGPTGGPNQSATAEDVALLAAYAAALIREGGDPRRALRHLALERDATRKVLRERLDGLGAP